MRARRVLGVTGLSALALLIPAAVLASQGGGPTGEVHINWWGFDAHAPAVGWLLVDFAIFLGLIVFLGRKPMREFLETRALGIRKALDEARQSKQEAEDRAAELETRIKDLDAEITRLREEIHQAGERERTLLEADGKRAAERMLRDADLQIQSDLARAKATLKTEAVALAIELAERKLRESLTAADYTRLNSEFATTFISGDREANRP